MVCDIATTLDILFTSVEPRNSLFNVLDLFLEWNREEAVVIRDKYQLKEEETVGISMDEN